MHKCVLALMLSLAAFAAAADNPKFAFGGEWSLSCVPQPETAVRTVQLTCAYKTVKAKVPGDFGFKVHGGGFALIK